MSEESPRAPIPRSAIRDQVIRSVRWAGGPQEKDIGPNTRIWRVGRVACNTIDEFLRFADGEELNAYMHHSSGSLRGRRSIQKIVEWVEARLLENGVAVTSDAICDTTATPP